jgi:ribosomal protein S25
LGDEESAATCEKNLKKEKFISTFQILQVFGINIGISLQVKVVFNLIE